MMAGSFLNNQQIKVFTTFSCLFSDIALSSWIYFRATNYDEYVKYVKIITESPDFQVQLYRVYMQSLTFGLLLFLATHLIIYFLYWKEYNSARVYLKFYCIFSSAGCLLLALVETAMGIVPMLLYGVSYYFIAKMIGQSKARSQT